MPHSFSFDVTIGFRLVRQGKAQTLRRWKVDLCADLFSAKEKIDEDCDSKEIDSYAGRFPSKENDNLILFFHRHFVALDWNKDWIGKSFRAFLV